MGTGGTRVFSSSQLAALTTAQITSFGRQNIGALSSGQFGAFIPTVLAALTASSA
jgi:hypothetical protein